MKKTKDKEKFSFRRRKLHSLTHTAEATTPSGLLNFTFAQRQKNLILLDSHFTLFFFFARWLRLNFQWAKTQPSIRWREEMNEKCRKNFPLSFHLKTSPRFSGFFHVFWFVIKHLKEKYEHINYFWTTPAIYHTELSAFLSSRWALKKKKNSCVCY